MVGRSEPLIPGLPDDIAEHCLVHLPYPYQTQARCVSVSWNKALTNPNFILSRKTLPFVFTFAVQKSTAKIQWQAFDPRSNRWIVIPPMPCPKSVSPLGFSCVALGRTLYVLGGLRSDSEAPLCTVMTFNTGTNKWLSAEPMLTPRSFFSAGVIGEKVVVMCGVELDNVTVECYDTKNNSWSYLAKMSGWLDKYDAAVVGDKMYVTEGWTWPFSFYPRGGVYDAKSDTWDEMSVGMKEGWTGMSVVLNDKLFVISEHGDHLMKVYVPDGDKWDFVSGRRFPCEVVQKPFTVSAAEGRIFVVSSGLDVAIGSVFKDEKSSVLRVEWEVVKGPKAFEDYVPHHSQVVYG
ncbi:hypothetical protein GIB67_022569 [Kingdonia uniflora]|uniref:F-box domain-containing protein n=1 Tax=Kingdonia uniflora TaxID=39325 RepID=A0A7J7L7A5_9MAGN|nr:hypothetical protein GIB67_022569 [Kingdonia uniflora]